MACYKFNNGLFYRSFYSSAFLNWPNHKNYYELLKVNDSCTSRELKESFLKLSMEHHPDKNNNTKESHDYFIKLNEAYNVLSKRNTRNDYDNFIKSSQNHNHYSYSNNYADIHSARRSYENEDYYSIKGVKKLPNYVIVLFCLLFTLIGISGQYLAIRSSVTFSRDKIRQDSARNIIYWEYARKQAIMNGNEEQLNKFKKGTLHGASKEEVDNLMLEKSLPDDD